MIIAIIPARLGSKGVPLKNLRNIGYKPMICHTIEAALQCEEIDKVVVSTDSERIADVARACGALVPYIRPKELADDDVTIARVVKHFTEWCNENAWDVEALVILQPTSPLRTHEDIKNSIKLFTKDIDTVVSVVKSTSIEWKLDNGIPISLRENRLNRQGLKPVYKENGAIFVTRPSVVTSETTIGKRVVLYEMDDMRSIDVDTYLDFRLAHFLLRGTKIIIHFKANSILGLGHYYRALSIANRLDHNDIVFVCSDYDERFADIISTIGYRYHLVSEPLRTIKEEQPTIIINDILDTSVDFMKELKKMVPVIINFEDLGEGRQHADLVFNALYEDFSLLENEHGGARYAVLREEFMFQPMKHVKDEVEQITITFGGTDPNNVTRLCAMDLPPKYQNINFMFIVGPGYKHDLESLTKMIQKYPNAEISSSSNEMSKHLYNADLVLTAGGRTVFESSSCGTPVIVICQNKREMTHRHITSKDGVINLGMFEGPETIKKLTDIIDSLVSNITLRAEMVKRVNSIVDGLGVFRIIGMIEKVARLKDVLVTL